MGAVPVKPDGNAPEGVDYNLWLGPAKERPFNPNRFHFNFRWYWDYAGFNDRLGCSYHRLRFVRDERTSPKINYGHGREICLSG
jgi:hypothetical protein